MFFAPVMHYVVPTTMVDVIKHLGLQDGLRLVVDAGDSNSTSGSSQVWSDTSGNSYAFNRGTTSGAQSSDPTFNGVAGRQSSAEYFSYDGGDFFRAAQSNPAWITNIHKNSAIFTLAQWVYLHNVGSTSVPWGGMGDAGNADGFAYNGFQFGYSSSVLRRLNLAISNEATVDWVYLKNSSAACNNNAWNFCAVSMNEAAGTLQFQINGTSESYTSQSYSSPAAGNAEATMEIGAIGAGTGKVASGSRSNSALGWSRELSASELASLYNASKAKFGH